MPLNPNLLLEFETGHRRAAAPAHRQKPLNPNLLLEFETGQPFCHIGRKQPVEPLNPNLLLEFETRWRRGASDHQPVLRR